MDTEGYNLFIGTSTGMIKGVYVGKDEVNVRAITKNCIRDKESISNKNEITFLNWSDSSEDEILIGMKNKMKTFNVDNEELSEEYHLPAGDVCGIFKNESTIFLACTSGSINSWKYPYTEKDLNEELSLNQNIEKMKRSITSSHIIATGGKDNDLKLWDLNIKNSTFVAKNIKPDELQLQVPVWVSDMTFFPDSEKIATCTRHGFVRLYDPLLPQRRPVFNFHESDYVFTCLSRTPNDHQLLVGSGYGDMILVDLRNKNTFAGKYKGFSGAVKNIVCPNNQSLVLSASLDRHFRIHDFTTRKLLVKEYMQSRLTTLLPKESFVLKQFKTEVEEAPKVVKKRTKERKIIEDDENDDAESPVKPTNPNKKIKWQRNKK